MPKGLPREQRYGLAQRFLTSMRPIIPPPSSTPVRAFRQPVPPFPLLLLPLPLPQLLQSLPPPRQPPLQLQLRLRVLHNPPHHLRQRFLLALSLPFHLRPLPIVPPPQTLPPLHHLPSQPRTQLPVQNHPLSPLLLLLVRLTSFL